MGRHKKIVESNEEPEKNIDTDEEEEFPESEKILVSSGCTLLNLALTNTIDTGYRTGRIVNIVGDKSTGKTLLAIEVMSYAYHLMKKNYDMKLIYDEGEAAFDKEYASKLGLPVDKIDFKESETVEEWYESLEKEVGIPQNKRKDFTIYVLDSLDALVSEEEMEQDFNKAGFGMSKQKQMSKLFRRLVRKLRTNNILLIIISQLRDKIGVTFGETKTRAGGRALDFYASQILWLYEKGKIKKGNLPVGLEIKAKVKKNKLWRPFREVNFSVLFEYGIDDLGSNVDFLKENKVCLNDSNTRFFYDNIQFSREDFIQYISENNKEQEIKELVKMTWDELEEECKVVRKTKYEKENNANNIPE